MITRFTKLVDLPELLRVEEAAAYLDCGRGVIYEMLRSGALPGVRLGRLLRIHRDALAALVSTEKSA